MMAQAKSGQQPQDPYARQSKALNSKVQRLRGWVGSDPAKLAELADALVELTAHRLLGHGYAAAAADGQDAVRRAGELLAAGGPIGPYTSIGDAARYVTAVIHLATIQTGLGRLDAAGHTMESLEDIREQLREHRLEVSLQPETVIWALSCSSRTALSSGDVITANAYADAAFVRLAESGLGNDPDAAYLAMDVNRLTSDARWAAGRAKEALSYLRAAKDHYDGVVAGRLDEPGRLSPALVERLAEPMFGLYRDMADRLVVIAEVDLGLMTRRRLIELLRGLVQRLGDPTRAQLAAALVDLARDLSKLDRLEEANAATAEATAIMPNEQMTREVVSLGTEMITWSPLPSTAAYATTTAASVNTKIVDLAALQRAWQQRTATWLEAERPKAQQLELQIMEQTRDEVARREAARLKGERAAAEQRAADQAKAAETERLEVEHRAHAEEAARLERKRRRQERMEAHRLEVERREAERREAERLEAERLELERLQAEIDELERREGN